jgi:glycosyltransferase involved in cell wall biosynthesis
MAKLGHEIVLICPEKDPAWYSGGAPHQSQVKCEEYDGFRVQRIPADPVVLNMAMMFTLLGTLTKQNFDIIHSHEYFSSCSFQSAIVSRTKNCPLVITQHNDELPLPLLNRFGYLLDTLTIGKYSFSKAEKIIALSNDIRLHLMRMGFSDKKIELIPNAVDTTFFSPDCENLLETKWGMSAPVVLFVGRLVAEKGVEFLIQAFHEVVKKIPDAKLVIVGGGPKENELKSLQRRLQTKNVFFVERVENRLMPNIYVGCNVLVVPSLREPFGNVVLEAMASGRPVIGSYVGGMKDTIVHGETGYHVPPGNTKMLSDFLLEILSDESLSVKLGKNARKRVLENYDSKIIAKRVEKIYTDAIS